MAQPPFLKAHTLSNRTIADSRNHFACGWGISDSRIYFWCHWLHYGLGKSFEKILKIAKEIMQNAFLLQH